MAVRKRQVTKKIPDEGTKLRALFSIGKFADMIYFHGGMKNFGKIHYDGLAWTESHKGQDIIRELILMPRGHLKTTIFTVLDILHQIYINPNIRIYVGSANTALAKAIAREVVANFTDPWLQEHVWNARPHFPGRLIPLMDKAGQQRRTVRVEIDGEFSDFEEDTLDDKKKIWRQDAIQVIRPYKLKEPTVVIGSTKSPATGFHYDRIYFDDIINFDNYDKPEKIERLDVWRNDMFSVLDDSYFDDDLYKILEEARGQHRYISNDSIKKACIVGGFVRAVGTRYFQHDWYRQLIDASKEARTEFEDEDERWSIWVRNIYNNGKDNSEGYLWGEKWTEKTERSKRKEVTKRHWYAQYLNEVIVDGEQILPMDKIKGLSFDAIKFVTPNAPRVYIDKGGFGNEDDIVEVSLRMCIDPAATCTPDADYTAIAVGGKDIDGNLYIVDLRVMRQTSDNWIKTMYEMLSRWNLKATHLETVGFASELKTTIRNKFNQYFPISIREYKPGVKSSKKERIEAGLEPLINNGMLYFSSLIFKKSEIVDQFNFFPSEAIKDDAPDVVQMLNEVCLKTAKTSNKVVPMDKYINNRWGGYY